MLIQNPPVQLARGLWMLGTTAHPVYLVRGESEAAIIEGGISAIVSLLCDQLAELGIAPALVKQVIVTHAHPDHVMALPRLRATFPDLAIVASAPAAAILSNEKAVGFFCQMDALFTDALTRAGMLPATASTQPPMPENRMAVNRIVREGDKVAVDDMVWTVLETPGHSDCSISLHNAEDRVLLISDASGYFMPTANTWWPNYFTGYGAYVSSLERLARVEADVLCLSHNGALQGAEAIRAYFAGTIAVTEQYHQRILNEATAGKTVRQIAEMLGEEIHGQLQTLPLDFFQKNCGLLVKQSLRHAGMAADK